jgi:hypothetical protein
MIRLIYWITISSILSLIIWYLLGSFPLSIFFATLFFSLSTVLFYYLDKDNQRSYQISFNFGLSRPINVLPYILGGISSFFIIILPSFNISIQSTSLFATFSSLSPLLLARVICGIYLLSVLPGYVLCKMLLRNSLSFFERIGIILALSYCSNAIIGLILWRLNLLNPASYVFMLWLVILGIVLLNWSSKNPFPHTAHKYVLSLETILLFLVSVILLIGSYSIVLSVGPISGITGADVRDYMISTNEIFHFGFSSYMNWWSSYLVVGNLATGLPTMYVYGALQYLVLLIPASVYFFMVSVFPAQKKAASISAFMISVLYGMSSLPFILKVVSTSHFSWLFMNGAMQSALQFFTKIFWANTQSYVLWDRTIEYALGLLALGLIFKYLRDTKKKCSLIEILLVSLLIVGAIFTHDLFFFIPFFVTIAVFSLFNHSGKKLVFILLGILMIFTISAAFSRPIIIDKITTSFIYSYYSIVNPSAGLSLVIITTSLVSTYVFLYFLFKTGFRMISIRVFLRRIHTFCSKESVMVTFWAGSLSLVILALFLSYLNYSQLNHVSMFSYSPWYVWVVFFGLQIPLIAMYLPRLLAKCSRESIMFLIIFTFSVLGVASFASFSIANYFSGGSGALYLFFMAYPLSFLAALAICVSILNNGESSVKNPKNIVLKTVSTHRRKFFYIISTVLIVSMASSFLSYVYSVEISFPNDQNISTLSRSDADVLQWMYSNLPNDAVVIALSETSYGMLCSILNNKILPIYLNVDEGPAGGSWVRNAILESQEPQAVLSCLYQSGATNVFVSSADSTLNQSDTEFAALLNDFPLAFELDDTRLYEIPRILNANSNYQVVSGLWDFPVQQQIYSLDKDSSSAITIDLNNSVNFWSVNALGVGSGLIGVPVLTINQTSTSKLEDDSLQITVNSGNYSRWQLLHRYSANQDWSSKDYVAFNWCGTNSKKTLSFEISSDITEYNYMRFDFVDNWIGWKRLVAPFNSPTETSTVSPDLTKVNNVALGFWLSNNVEGTFFIGKITVDVGQWISQDSTVPSDQLITELLLKQRVSFSSISEDKLDHLNPDNVYFFTYNPCFNKNTLSNLTSYVAAGANLIFTNPKFSSPNSSLLTLKQIPNILNYTMIPNPSTNLFSSLNFDATSLLCSLYNPLIVHFTNQTGLQALASFSSSNGSSVPWIVREEIGEGSIIMADLSFLGQSSSSQRDEVLNELWSLLLNVLPKPIHGETIQDLQIPSQTFDDITYRSTSYDLWSNTKLQGNLMFNQKATIQGNFSIASSYFSSYSAQLFVTNMSITPNNNSITNSILYNVIICGNGGASFKSSVVELPNFPTGFYTIANITNIPTGCLLTANVKAATITYQQTPGGKIETICGDLMISAYSNSLTIRAVQPSISIEGSIEGTVYGAFIKDGTYFYARALDKSLIEGSFNLRVLYSSGITFTQLNNINKIIQIKTDV